MNIQQMSEKIKVKKLKTEIERARENFKEKQK